jgi:predicted PurR-regulated permease PerM
MRRGWAVTVLAVLACLYTIYFARGFLLPITCALLLSFVFSPVIRALGRVHIPAPAGAALIVLAFVSVVGFAGYRLAGPVQVLVGRAPEALRKAGVRLRVVSKPVDRVTEAAEQVEKATAVDGASRTPQVVLRGPSLVSRFVGTTQVFIESALEIVLLLFFLLAAGDLFLEKLVKVLPLVADKRNAVRIARAIERSISQYLVTATVLNIGEGIVVAVAMWVIGMPAPVVWGVMVACLEFIPYIGMLVITSVLTVVGLTTFPTLSHALAAPAVFFVINTIQGNFITPLAMGRRLTLNPVALLVGLSFWWSVWGVAGALVAVPLLAAFKIVCDHLPSLAPIGEFLGGRDPSERRQWLRLTATIGRRGARGAAHAGSTTRTPTPPSPSPAAPGP